MSDVPYLYLLLFGWWVPATAFYVTGLIFLLLLQRRPKLIVIWCVVFLASLAWTSFDGIYRKQLFDRRAETFKNPVIYAKPPDDIRVIQSSTSAAPGALAPYQGCSLSCVMLLFSGRFDNVIIHDPGASNGDFNAVRRPYRNFSLINQVGCKINPDVEPNLFAWFKVGRCVGEVKSDAVDGRRFVVIEDQADDPMSPPWPIQLSFVQLLDGDRVTPIARAESAARAEFDFPFPVPGFFPRNTNGLPSDFRPGFLFYQYDYGKWQQSQRFVEQVFGISINGPVPKPPEGG
jgi:hypothetical protein